MPLLPIYTFDHAVLRKKAKLIRKMESDLPQLGADMLETMHNANGVGLAANQVGSLQRIIVVDLSEMEDALAMKPIILINPEVLQEEGEQVMEEGCLSIPDIREEVVRAEVIKIRYKDADFNPQELAADGFLARVILHEIDHLNGVLFIDHLNAVKRKLLKGRLNKIRNGEIEVNYPIVSSVPVAAEK